MCSINRFGELAGQNGFAEAYNGGFAAAGDDAVCVLPFWICGEEIKRSEIIGAILFAKNITVHEENAHIERLKVGVTLDIYKAAILDIGGHGVAGDADAKIGAGRNILRNGNKLKVLALDG